MKTFRYKVQKIELTEDIVLIIVMVLLLSFGFGLVMFILMLLYFHKTILPKKDYKPEDEKKNANSNYSKNDDYEIYPKFIKGLKENVEVVNNKNAVDRIHGQNQLYSWMVIIMSLCYSIPAIQIVIRQQQTITGMHIYFEF